MVIVKSRMRKLHSDEWYYMFATGTEYSEHNRVSHNFLYDRVAECRSCTNAKFMYSCEVALKFVQ
jgi:hypothetical protein